MKNELQILEVCFVTYNKNGLFLRKRIYFEKLHIYCMIASWNTNKTSHHFSISKLPEYGSNDANILLLRYLLSMRSKKIKFTLKSFTSFLSSIQARAKKMRWKKEKKTETIANERILLKLNYLFLCMIIIMIMWLLLNVLLLPSALSISADGSRWTRPGSIVFEKKMRWN